MRYKAYAIQTNPVFQITLFQMIYDNPKLKPIYYPILPNRLFITVLKSIPIGFAYKVIDDMEEFDLG